MAVETVAEKFVDLKKLIESKNPALAKWLPSPILNWIRKIIHEDDINRFIKNNGHLRDLEFVKAVLDEVGMFARATGLENIPTSGGCIVAANHPLGGMDGVAMMHIVGQKRPDMRFFVNDLLLHMTGFGELFVGVNKHGTNLRESLKQMDQIFGSDKCVLFFPAGLVSRRQNGVIQDLDWQKSFIAKAVQHQKPIIPTFISGKNSEFFYNLAYWRKKLGIKANLEMFFLVQEIYKQRGNTIDFQFGKPIEPTYFTKEKTTTEWAAWLKNEIYAMDKNVKIT